LEEAAARVKQRVEEKTWEAFRRTALLGESTTEVARELEMPVASVFKAKSNVQKKLQQTLAQLDLPGSRNPS
jgi:DNA-directed RNA polymerase specialized sigma24 family protein